MNYLHIWLESDVFNQVDIKFFDVTELNRGNIFIPDFLTDILVVHIFIVSSGGRFQLIFCFDIIVKEPI